MRFLIMIETEFTLDQEREQGVYIEARIKWSRIVEYYFEEEKMCTP